MLQIYTCSTGKYHGVLYIQLPFDTCVAHIAACINIIILKDEILFHQRQR